MTEIHNYVLPGGPDDLFVSDCWMNWCRKERAAQVKHNHNNSLISGTYYVSREDYVHAGLTLPNLSRFAPISHSHEAMGQRY